MVFKWPVVRWYHKLFDLSSLYSLLVTVNLSLYREKGLRRILFSHPESLDDYLDLNWLLSLDQINACTIHLDSFEYIFITENQGKLQTPTYGLLPWHRWFLWVFKTGKTYDQSLAWFGINLTESKGSLATLFILY